MNLKISNSLKNMNTSKQWFKRPTDDDLVENKNVFTVHSDDVSDSVKKSNNLDEKAKFFARDMSKEEVLEYIKNHTIGEKIASSLCSQAGGRIATFSKFVEMVEDGYNIVKANLVSYVNGEYLIDMEYQLEMKKDKKLGMGGR